MIAEKKQTKTHTLALKQTYMKNILYLKNKAIIYPKLIKYSSLVYRWTIFFLQKSYSIENVFLPTFLWNIDEKELKEKKV